MARIGANLADVKDNEMNQDRSWTVYPDGWYRAMGKENAYKATAAGNGMCLHLTHILLDPQYSGKSIRDFLTLEHPKPETVHIAKVRLKELAAAVGHPTPNHVEDADELMGKPFMMRLYSEQAREAKYGDRNGMANKLGEYKTCDGVGASHAPPADNDPPPPSGDDIPF